MHRRTLLSSIGLGLTATLAGCTASAGTGDIDDPTTTPTPETVEAVIVESGKRLTAVVGGDALEGDTTLGTHHVHLQNDAETPWVVGLDVSPELVPGHSETYEIQGDAEVDLVFRVPAEYDLSVTDRQSGASTRETITPEDFVCNPRWTVPQWETTITPDDGGITVTKGPNEEFACSSLITEERPSLVTLGNGSLPDSEGTKPHAVTVANVTESTAEVAFNLTTEEGTVVFGGDYRIEPNARLQVVLTEPHHVIAELTRESGDGASVTIAESRFDCNNSTTVLALTEDGIQARTLSTLVFCGTSEE
ncbi:hypothetical protein [Haloferax sp. DFSO60]|uniref:hypothetical protein n=1 Tax=Haloferax sp. DFSO60 TaxID=3388652 RepID=UPI0039783F53